MSARTGQLAVALALWAAAPVWIFARFHDFGLFRTETLLVAMAAALVAGAVGALAQLGGRLPSALAAGAVLALVADVQLRVPDPTVACVAVFAGVSALGFALGSRFPPVALATAIGFAGSSLALPVGAADSPKPAPAPPAVRPAAERKRVPIVHLVLDEQIGIEAIPRDVDADAARARALRDVYLERGFRVFGRAYSRAYDTHDSLSLVANFGEDVEARRVWRGFELTQNRYAETFRELGYRVRVFQTDHLDLCVAASVPAADCRTQTLESPRFFDRTGHGPLERTRMFAAMLARLSVWIPNPGLGRVSSFAGLAQLDELEEAAAGLQPGELLIAHVMLPHYPLVLDENCAARRRGHGSAPRDESAYEAYFDQMTCTHARVARVLDAAPPGTWLIVHGDHGARRMPERPMAGLEGEEAVRRLTDGYATLFAARTRAMPPGYDRRIASIDELVTAALHLRELVPRSPVVEVGAARPRTFAPLPEFGRAELAPDGVP